LQQEAGLLLWYHSQKGEDGRTEVLGAGVLNPCLETLDSSTALPADKSTAAGINRRPHGILQQQLLTTAPCMRVLALTAANLNKAVLKQQ
jgi:hypothetical protein